MSAKTHTYTACPVCGQARLAFVLKAKDHTVSQEYFEIWECADCSLRFTQHIPIESDIARYYQAEEYVSHTNTRKGFINSLYHLVRSYTLRQKRRTIEKICARKSGKLLDIGCGTGEFLAEMKRAGWEVEGLEPDPGARSQAVAKGLMVHDSSQLFGLTPNTYDAITLWHVLEHVHKLEDYVAQLCRLLKPEGKLFIAVPNYLSSDADHYQAEWAAYDVPRHLYHFTPDAIDIVLVRNGLTGTHLFAMPFDAFYVSLLSEKYVKGATRWLPALQQGFRSWLQARKDSEKASAVLYVYERIEQ